MSDELNNTRVETEYDAAQIQVLEGLGSGPETARHVYRLHLRLRFAPSGL